MSVMELKRPMATAPDAAGGSRRKRTAANAARARVTGAARPAAIDSRRDHEPAPADDPDLTPTVGANLRRLRTKRGLSLDGLAHLSGVSRAMLGQIELRQSAPTINVLWKIVRALNVPFSALVTEQSRGHTKVLTEAQAKILTSQNGKFSSRALFPFDEPRKVEFYELRLAGHAAEVAEPHSPGTVENLVVTSGALEIRVGDERHRLATGDAIQFGADVPHEYRNPGKQETVMYLVMTYAEQVG